jgi:tRNA(Ile)-lysidine synthase
MKVSLIRIPFSIFVLYLFIMNDKFKSFIKSNRLIHEGDKILLAVSGGIDSMVMANLFLRTDFTFGIAHCNFNLRGSESDSDEEFVRDYAVKRNIPFYVKRFDTKNFAVRNGISVQMAARELRYKWFETIMKKYGYSSIALAHNLNDNIETFLINLARGTGITGLTGIKPINNNLIRPLLFATRKEITEYSYEYEVPYREDNSNAETKYLRNKIRHQLIPLFKEINPSIETTLYETILRVNEINEIYINSISEIKSRITIKRGNLVVFRIEDLQKYDVGKTILYELFKTYGVGSHQLEDLLNIINGSSGKQLNTLTYRIIKNRGELLLSENITDKKIHFLISNINDFKNVPGISEAFITDASPGFGQSDSKTNGCFDSERIVFPVTIRRWRSGDTFYPLGMKQRKKLSDYFIDNKLSLFEKENCLILESEGKIAWIIGKRIDERFKVTESTKSILNISFSQE